MLYDCWRRVAQQHASELALHDLNSGQKWTFAQLARKAEDLPPPGRPVAYPQGHSPEFVFAVLAAWRHNAVVCPLEPHERPAAFSRPPEGCCHLKTTSATSGPPRFVAFRPGQLAADALNIAQTMGLRPDWPNLGVISLAHSYGFSNLVLPLLLHGIPLVIVPSALPEVVRRAAQTVPALTLAGVPALWHAWHEATSIPANVRLAISAGAPLSSALEREVFERVRLKLHNFYGSSECGGIAYDRSSTPRADDACVGEAMDQVLLALDYRGCLKVHSRAVGETYWPEPEDTLGNGSFQTNDLASLSAGRVYLQGRVSDQINVAGRKLSPAAVEQALKQHAEVQECLVFGVPSADEDRAEQIVACVVAKAAVASEELKQFLLNRLPAWQIPRQWWFVDSLEANHRGKLSRPEWRRRFLERHS